MYNNSRIIVMSNMAATGRIVMPAAFTFFLYVYAIIGSGNSANSAEETFVTLISTDSHLMEYPRRNSGDFPRRSRKPSISTYSVETKGWYAYFQVKLDS